MVLARYTFFGKKIAAKIKAVSHQVIEAGGHAACGDIFRPVLSSNIEAASGPCVYVLEDSTLLFPVEKVSCRNPVAMALKCGLDRY